MDKFGGPSAPKKDLVFKMPTTSAPRRKSLKVLDEDTYVEEIGKIIERDFFPDLEKLKAQNEYLGAMERNDTVKLRELHAKYSGRRPISERISSPATFETPANIHGSQSGSEINVERHNIEKEASEKKLSLDQYLNVHTSQDNESFEELLVEAERKHVQKYSYLYHDEGRVQEEQNKLLMLPSVEQQALPAEKKLDIDTWSYKNKNYIMFVPDGVELSQEQQLELNKKRQEVVHSNTRLLVNPFNESRNKQAINEVAKTQAKVLDGKIGVDGKELVLQSDTPQVNGFSLVRSPSPAPGVMCSPLMTWGEIEGTPFRLDGGDTPLPRSLGTAFKMNEPPRREQLAMALAEKVGEKNRDQRKRAIDAQRKQFASPSPRPQTSQIDRLATMSPAARKLATSKLKLGVNSELLSSYSPSPNRTRTPRTPRRITTPKITGLGIKKTTEVSTDDLLKISLPKRQKASDFF